MQCAGTVPTNSIASFVHTLWLNLVESLKHEQTEWFRLAGPIVLDLRQRH